jgi:methoxymalonate biosynthesis acyl carrier protein
MIELATLQLQYQITELFLEKLNLEVPAPDTDLLETGMVDSLTFVELLLLLEQNFGLDVSIDELEIDNFRSVTSIATFIANRTR